ncbi:MAG: LacI family DNA-binding transcriptional regulator [Proteobacteria bacterium]|jgi:LacI family transcriptional regulator|nr:transcriptional regulator [Methylibium sp.]MBY0366627.1 LacI family DNA-binding transcriptional regulator [Burkholderiaceae bacterium]MCH8855201.1 LacI family DNA-binding transcriptional regulator [Pseudomonadota bacterium]|mmetsp:Transcript_23205/g.54847  ORF Transcript_23205/g.54847 Transcript_23205/m.54847 type:complete len:346 (-) Transcript_23205:3298-4335(-)
MSARGASPTIVDVAREAGVSIKTVSRVLNHEPGVHENTRDQVLKVVEALRYRPKQSARSLAGGRSFLIGLLYYDPSANFVGSVQQGATLRCRELGYHLVVESLHNDAPDLRQQVDRMVLALRPDGMILTPPLCDNPEVLAALRESGTPCVLISPERDIRGVPSVRMDDVHAAEEITNLLLSLGHRHIAFIKGPPDQSASAARYQGFLSALHAHDLHPDPELIQPGAFTFATGREAAHHLLSRRQRPTAVFASNDDMALGVLAAAQRLGLAVPGELSVVGFDDSPMAALVWPSLTTVRQPVAEMARVAVEMLVSGPQADMAAPLDDADLHKVLRHELVVRDSTRAR